MANLMNWYNLCSLFILLIIRQLWMCERKADMWRYFLRKMTVEQSRSVLNVKTTTCMAVVYVRESNYNSCVFILL